MKDGVVLQRPKGLDGDIACRDTKKPPSTGLAPLRRFFDGCLIKMNDLFDIVKQPLTAD